MEKRYLKILSQAKLFANIEENQLGTMLSCLGTKVKTYQKGDCILAAGDEVKSIGIVLSGYVDVVKEDIVGRRTLLTTLGPSDIFGEAMACAGITKSPTSVIAGSKAEVCFTDYSRVVNTCTSSCSFHTQLIHNMLRLMAYKNLFLNKKLDYLSLKSIRQRLCAYLLDQSAEQKKLNFTIPFNREGLADYLSVDRSALSRELSRMKSEGLINYNKNYFELLDVERLAY